ncbi:hypothetical protein PsorP6_000591 [Peronosclerospora sorghi]|uniref:Uncharacterized protein n=1 Tax=Peronosclerospora sorghi TaxID=230839 RepID=A0ACC0WVT7_9STRA|nr:hypothetical protein PsorP6_000591 [Peronosclerospora sorghi]
MLGDPVGLATDVVNGFALSMRQLKRDVKGQSRRKGESAVTVVQTVFGVPLKSIGKVSNGLGDVVKKATYFESQEGSNEPRHIPEEWQSLGKSIAFGVTGFVKEPVRGAKSGGVKGFAKGVGRGTLQLLSVHLMDEKHFEGTRRPARNLTTGSLKQLSESNVITEVEVHVLYVDGCLKIRDALAKVEPELFDGPAPAIACGVVPEAPLGKRAVPVLGKELAIERAVEEREAFVHNQNALGIAQEKTRDGLDQTSLHTSRVPHESSSLCLVSTHWLDFSISCRNPPSRLSLTALLVVQTHRMHTRLEVQSTGSRDTTDDHSLSGDQH